MISKQLEGKDDTVGHSEMIESFSPPSAPECQRTPTDAVARTATPRQWTRERTLCTTMPSWPPGGVRVVVDFVDDDDVVVVVDVVVDVDVDDIWSWFVWFRLCGWLVGWLR